jgi:segregation and condensation protein B
MVNSPSHDDPGRDSDSEAGAPDPAAHFGLDHFEAVSGEQGISLDELSRAYAQLIGKGEDPYEPSAEAAATDDPLPVDSDGLASEEETGDLSPRSIVEAMLFVGHPSNEPISGQQMASLMRGVPPREIDELIGELNDEYLRHGHPYHIVSAGAGYRLELRDEFSSLRNVFYGRVREARLSQAAVDVLAIVAYQPGLSRPEIDRVRGRPSGSILAQLVRRRLLRVQRPDQKPRVPRFYTTERFLELFALSNLDELPRSQDID